MKAAFKTLMALAMVFSLVLVATTQAQKDKDEKKEVTLKGTITCAKCDLGKADKCTNVIQVKEGDKEVLYYIDDEGAKEKYHKEICKASKKGSVTGTVSEKDGKKMIKLGKDGIKFD
jgi:hypothetical protein